MSCSSLLLTLTLRVMQMIIHPILLMKRSIKLYLSLKKKQKAYLSGSLTTNGKPIPTNAIFISSGSQNELKLGNWTIKCSTCEKLPEICIFMYVFFRSLLIYRPLVRICHSRALNNEIKIFHERCFRIDCNDKCSIFQNVLDQDRYLLVHIYNLQTLVTEMYKVSKEIAPKTFSYIFSSNSRVSYDLRCQSEFSRPLEKSVVNGTKTVSYLDSRIWDLVPIERKQKESLTAFRKAHKT